MHKTMLSIKQCYLFELENIDNDGIASQNINQMKIWIDKLQSYGGTLYTSTVTMALGVNVPHSESSITVCVA